MDLFIDRWVFRLYLFFLRYLHYVRLMSLYVLGFRNQHSINTKDQICCEAKEKTKARLRRSPDAEAVVIALEN